MKKSGAARYSGASCADLCSQLRTRASALRAFIDVGQQLFFKIRKNEAEFAKQLGNTMSVNVLERILAAALPAAGVAAALRDRWASGEAAAVLEATRDCKLIYGCRSRSDSSVRRVKEVGV